MPLFAEVMEGIMQINIFNMEHMKLSGVNYDPFDDSEGDDVQYSVQSSMIVAKCIRSVLKSLVVCHFGEIILDELFVETTLD